MTPWKVLAALLLVQAFPSHISSFSNTFVDPSLFEKKHQISLNQWSSTWREKFHQLKAKMLLAVEFFSIRITLRKSDILHPDAERKVVCSAIDGQEKHRWILRHLTCIWKLEFWWLLHQAVWLQHNRSDEINPFEMGESSPRDGHGQQYGAASCVASSSFVCALRYMNIRRHSAEDKDSEAGRLRNKWRNNLEFYLTIFSCI